MLRLASFNLENLDSPVELRLSILRPALERLGADVLCLQEVNAQHIPGREGRSLRALDELLAGTVYAQYHRTATTAADGAGPADVHNLVTLSRFPILRQRQICHDLVPPVEIHTVTANPKAPEPTAVRFDRPILVTEIDLGPSKITIINVHLRAGLASPIPGGKKSSFAWNTVGSWAEGYYISGLKRSGQALELRLAVDGLFDADAKALILVAGDFNAEDHETPLRLAIGAAEHTGNSELTERALVVLDRSLDPARQFSVLHHGRPQMLDHLLASHSLYGHFRGMEVHNEALGDEAVAYAEGIEPKGSYHAALVAMFDV